MAGEGSRDRPGGTGRGSSWQASAGGRSLDPSTLDPILHQGRPSTFSRTTSGQRVTFRWCFSDDAPSAPRPAAPSTPEARPTPGTKHQSPGQAFTRFASTPRVVDQDRLRQRVGTPGHRQPGNGSHGTWHRLPRQTGIEAAHRAASDCKAPGPSAPSPPGTRAGRPPRQLYEGGGIGRVCASHESAGHGRLGRQGSLDGRHQRQLRLPTVHAIEAGSWRVYGRQRDSSSDPQGRWAIRSARW
jgi:hypothetical protein